MRFETAWANVASENNILKLIVGVLSFSVTLLSLVVISISGKTPIVIERACTTQVTLPVSDQHTPKEIEAFLKEVLPKRFDSVSPDEPAFFSQEEIAFRKTEQTELKNKSMLQLLVRACPEGR